MKTHKLSELILDYGLYPRSQVDAQHTGYMLRSLESGAEFPPIVIDQKSKRIIDGFHRYHMYRRYYGDTHEVSCVEKQFKSDAEMFVEAMRLNASHGRNLTTHDRAHCIIVANQLGIDDDSVAAALSVDPSYVGELRVGRLAKANDKLEVPLKRTIKHKHNQKLTKRQVEANKKLSGMNQVFYVNQVIELLEADLIDTADEGLMERLTILRDLLAGFALPAD